MISLTLGFLGAELRVVWCRNELYGAETELYGAELRVVWCRTQSFMVPKIDKNIIFRHHRTLTSAP